MKGRQAGSSIADYVIYDPQDHVIAVGNRAECMERLGLTQNTFNTLIVRPFPGFTVVKFYKDEYNGTIHGKEITNRQRPPHTRLHSKEGVFV